ncbi:hypothetical protein ACH5RR_017382 [Cinchona calisaya]|uniref:Uncharacterized protein n=1 Tax=Cinchona calisaya TaxID=153742 RepID=A0ABD2ZZ11_9GENT
MATAAEVVKQLNQFNNLDFLDISLVDNVPMDFSPTSNGCTRGPQCTADINGQCLNELRAPGGCNNPCTVFKTDEYCCNSGSCGPTDYSRFFKNNCPDAYSYPKDDQTSGCRWHARDADGIPRHVHRGKYRVPREHQGGCLRHALGGDGMPWQVHRGTYGETPQGHARVSDGMQQHENTGMYGVSRVPPCRCLWMPRARTRRGIAQEVADA